MDFVDFTNEFELFPLQHQLGNTIVTVEEAENLYADGRGKQSFIGLFVKGMRQVLLIAICSELMN